MDGCGSSGNYFGVALMFSDCGWRGFLIMKIGIKGRSWLSTMIRVEKA